MDFGYDIVHVKNKAGSGYYMGSREFELPELKLLVDVVQASRFITQRKSRELIQKLELLKEQNVDQLERDRQAVITLCDGKKRERDSLNVLIRDKEREIEGSPE